MIQLKRDIPNTVIHGDDCAVAIWIDQMRCNRNGLSLLPFLRYDHPVYAQRSTNEVIRIRGYLMAAFAQTGLPNRGVTSFLEEFDHAHSPYILAGAAIGLRGLGKPTVEIMNALLNAIQRLQFEDDSVCFEQFKPDWHIHKGRSALTELLLTVELFSDRLPIPARELHQLANNTLMSASGLEVCNRILKLQEEHEPDNKFADDCCKYPAARLRNFLNAPHSFSGIRVQDQNGHLHLLSDLMKDKPSFLCFFYTRCDNVYRCSLTITRLGLLQKALKEAGIAEEIRLLAISFDAAFDLPYRMKAFAKFRGFQCNENARCLRVKSGMERLLGCVRPGVNFNDGLVNQHGVAYFLFDRFGFLKQRISATEWDKETICEDLAKLRNQKTTYYRRLRNSFGAGVSIAYSVVLAFFPKCPLCAAAYLSAMGISSASLLRYHRLLLPALLLLFGWHLQAVARRAWRRNWYLPLAFSLAGAFCMAWSAFGTPDKWWTYAGILLVGTGSLLNSWERTAKKNTKVSRTASRLLPSLLFQKRQI